MVVDEPATKLAALTAGELDFAGIQPAHADVRGARSRSRRAELSTLLTYVIALNTRRPPFDVARGSPPGGRAVDRREIVDGYLYGFGTPARTPVPPDVPGYVPVAADTSARDASGPPLQFELLTVGSGEAPLEQMVQARLRRAGIEVEIRQLELSAFLARVYGPTHDFDAAVLGGPATLGLDTGPLAGSPA